MIYETLYGQGEIWEYRDDPTPEKIYFICPNCDAEVVQDPKNFHYWCSSCGQNARDIITEREEAASLQ